LASYPSYCFSHTEPFTHRRFCTEAVTQEFLHTETLKQKRFYTQTLLHTEAFTHIGFYTQTLDTFTHIDFCTQTPLHTDAFTHRHFYTQTPLHTDIFTRRHFYTQTLLHTEAFTHRSFYTQKLLHTEAFKILFLTSSTWWHLALLQTFADISLVKAVTCVIYSIMAPIFFGPFMWVVWIIKWNNMCHTRHHGTDFFWAIFVGLSKNKMK